jgi:hypothetical protein
MRKKTLTTTLMVLLAASVLAAAPAGASTTRRVVLDGSVPTVVTGSVKVIIERRSASHWRLARRLTVRLDHGHFRATLALRRGTYRMQAEYDGCDSGHATRTPARIYQV